MIILDTLKALVYTAVFSLLATPLDFRLARAIGAIDIPKDGRRMHSSPIPRIGGISVFASFTVFSFIFCQGNAPELVSLLSGAVLIVVLGIVDDCLALPAKLKLTVQFTASTFSVVGLMLYGEVISPITVALAVLWLLTLTNAHNFIDGLDGLCVGVSLIEATAIGVLLLIRGSVPLGLSAFVLGGACIGFFPFNASNAKIFMGDTGSTFLGFVLGFFSLELLRLDLTPHAFLAIGSIFFVPLADISFAVIRRLSQGKSPFAPDRSHIHHLLADGKLGHKRASVAIRLASLLGGIIGLLIYAL